MRRLLLSFLVLISTYSGGADAGRLLHGTAPPTSFQGFVSTMGRIVSSKDNTFTQLMSRSQHTATENLGSVKFIFQNYYAANPDQGVGAATTITAAVEYPSGTIAAQIKFSSSASGTIPDVSTLLSDATNLSMVPSGANYWVRAYATNPNGIVYLGEQQSGGASEQMVVAAGGLSDQTMTGAAISGGTSKPWVYPPLAIVATTVKPCAVIIGDSRSVYDGNNNGQGIIAPSFVNAGVPFVSIAIFSARAYQWMSFATARNVLLSYCSQLVNALGINDKIDLRTDAQLVADLQTINAASSAKYKYNTTLLPYTTDCNNTTPIPCPAAPWTTTTQQTPVVSPSTFNDLVRAGFAGQSGYYDLADVTMSARNSNLWIVVPSPPYTFEGLHLIAGTNLISASGAIVPHSYPFLLKRDLDPASNDNDPMWLEKAA